MSFSSEMFRIVIVCMNISLFVLAYGLCTKQITRTNAIRAHGAFGQAVYEIILFFNQKKQPIGGGK